MTVCGTIFGHDTNNDINAVRKFGAFAGTSWLRHEKAIAETGAASTEQDFGLNGKTLEVVITKDGKGLHHMIVQVDDMISAIYYVKEKTLLAAQMEKIKFAGETDEISAMLHGLDLGTPSDAGNGTAESDARKGETTVTNAKDQGADFENGSLSEGSEVGTAGNKGKGSEHDAAAHSSSSSKVQLSKIRILEIRAETMAEALKEDICGPDFKMPPEFR